MTQEVTSVEPPPSTIREGVEQFFNLPLEERLKRVGLVGLKPEEIAEAEVAWKALRESMSNFVRERIQDEAMRLVAAKERTIRPELTEKAKGTNQTEDEFVAWAQQEKLRVHRDGWPDFLCGDGDHLFAVEVKKNGNKLSKAQTLMSQWLSRAGVEVFVWTPGRGLRKFSYTTRRDTRLQSTLARIRRDLDRFVSEVHGSLGSSLICTKREVKEGVKAIFEKWLAEEREPDHPFPEEPLD